MNQEWQYFGDINLGQGGLFWCEDGSEDYVLTVRVTPASDMGGPDNVFLIESGSVYLPEDDAKRKDALDAIGVEPGEATRRDLVVAFVAYHGIERDAMNGETWIRMGKACPYTTSDNWAIEPDFVFHGRCTLAGIVGENHLGGLRAKQVRAVMEEESRNA